ncbi:MAG TPA: hypothetical protein VKX17_28665 [Planctomycetota bacterium]|nr:hypothetical protein [Planctomycetota bacterium]
MKKQKARDKKKDEDDRNLVICQRVAERPADVPSVIKKCSGCGQAVYVAHTTLARLEKEGQGKPVVYSCIACLPTFDVDVSETMRPSPEQLAEIEKVIGRKLTEEDIQRSVEHFKSMYRTGRSDRN